MAVHSERHCDFQMTKPSVFNRLSMASNSSSAKRRRSRKKKSFSDIEYLEVIFNMVGPSVMLSKSKERQLTLSSEESDTERSSSLKEILTEPEGKYQRTRI